MNVKIKEYSKAYESEVAAAMNRFEDYLYGLDSLGYFQKRTRGDFGVRYVKETIKKIKKHRGKIYVAIVNESVVGFIAGVIEKASPSEVLETGKQVYGKIIELFIEEAHRGKGAGRMLLDEMENFFKEKECTRLLISVFAPNKKAYDIYVKRGYEELGIELMKKINS